ncbi:hypothetical protein PBV87_12880 [Niameybacter massiliensis]|uniref:Uncharacterized protein n=1 Tax=Holtiella tumoricola TaxID=3018743 RepID=A0AA42DNQ4_9FIRM|nr:hypothetical protein [Holtiella tumoricola]MDA3732383.1 hypothetical protein [Holtiella tumoricola]
MGFKEQINKDLDQTFFNIDEFAEEHIINGQKISIVVDNDRLEERSKKEYDGLYVGELLFFVPKSRLSAKLKQDGPVIFDGKQMYVFSLREDNGVYEVILNQNLVGG